MLWLAVGTVAYAFIGWRWSAPAAAWIAPVFLLRFFRNQEKWYTPLLSLPFLYAAFLTNMIGAVAADHRGTVLARQDYFMTEDRLMFADVPIEGTRTLYGCLGDWFAWASIALLAALVGLIIKRRTQAK